MVKSKPLFFTTLTVICFLMITVSPALPQGTNTTTPPPEEKVHITSDSMVFDEAHSQVEFTGNVVATRLDATIHADHVKVILYSEAEKKNRAATEPGSQGVDNVKQLIASGNVRVEQNDGTATADKAVYTPEKQTITLTGNAPTVVSGSSHISGKKITLYQDTRRVVVESDDTKRVEAVFDSTDTNSEKTEPGKK